MREKLGVAQIREFLEKENLTTDFSEIQYVLQSFDSFEAFGGY